MEIRLGIRPNPMRIALAAIALALAVLSFAQHRALVRERRAEARWLESSGVPVPPGLRGEPDRLRVRLRAARAALAFEMDPARAATLSTLSEAEAARERQAGAERMAGAARSAASVLADRPAAWDASMILGAATYLSWLQARDTHLFTAAARWEEPLAAALRLAPSRREPARFLASAYLDVWPALSPAKREAARALLAETFRNPADLGMLVDRWFEIAHATPSAARGHDEFFALIPHDPEAWNQVLNALSRQHDGPGWSAAWARWDAALLDQLRRETAQAEGQLAAGDLRGARQRFLSILAQVRPDARYRDVLATALERCPPGPVDRATGRRLVPLLSWALDRCLYGDCALEPAALQRLARLVRDADAPAEALTAVVTGDLPRAQTLERRAGILWSEEWAPFLVAKSRALAERGRVDEARETLTQVPRSWERHPLYWQARLDLARAQEDGGGFPERGLGGGPAPADLAADRLAALQREAWPGTDWEWRRETARLLMLTARAADHLAVELDEAPPNGAVVELRLDGRSLGAFSVPPALAGGTGGPRTLRLDGRPLGLGPGLHLLEVQGLEGGRVVPGDVRLLL